MTGVLVILNSRFLARLLTTSTGDLFLNHRASKDAKDGQGAYLKIIPIHTNRDV